MDLTSCSIRHGFTHPSVWACVTSRQVKDQTILKLAVTRGKLEEFHGVELNDKEN